MSKITLIAIVSLLALLVLIFYVNPFKSEERVNIRKFRGNAVNIDGNIVTLYGIFDGLAGTIPKKLLSEQNFSFRVDDETTFKMLIINLPSWEELTANGVTSGSYDLQGLPRTEGESSLEDLKKYLISDDENISAKRILVEADFPISIYKTKDSVASSVYYQIMIQPPPKRP